MQRDLHWRRFCLQGIGFDFLEICGDDRCGRETSDKKWTPARPSRNPNQKTEPPQPVTERVFYFRCTLVSVGEPRDGRNNLIKEDNNQTNGLSSSSLCERNNSLQFSGPIIVRLLEGTWESRWYFRGIVPAKYGPLQVRSGRVGRGDEPATSPQTVRQG
jgi:hypothetical protein